MSILETKYEILMSYVNAIPESIFVMLIYNIPQNIFPPKLKNNYIAIHRLISQYSIASWNLQPIKKFRLKLRNVCNMILK